MPKIVEHYQFISYFMVSPSMINWWVLKLLVVTVHWIPILLEECKSFWGTE